MEYFLSKFASNETTQQYFV